MARWDQATALAELDILLEESRRLEGVLPGSEQLIAWGYRVTDFLTDVFGEGSSYYGGWTRISWRAGQGIVGGPARPDESWDPQRGIDRLRREAVARGLTTARGILSAARQRLEAEPDISRLHSGKDTAPEASLLIKIINLAEYKLRKVMREAPRNERAVQDEFEKLLIGADVPYAREAKRVEYSSKTYVPDFTIDRAQLAVELKVCLAADREKALPAEINDDILAYKRDYPNMLFVVYDTGFIRDVDRFGGNFEEENGVVVRVVKH
jgi:hypothetical protein